MCNCGRTSQQQITSVQAAQEEAARRAEQEAQNAEVMTASAQNAVGNATSGWVLIEDPA